MLVLAQSLSETSASLAMREIGWLIPVLQTIHILAIAVVLSSMLMIDLRVLQAVGSRTQSLADAARRFEAWIWSGLAVLAASGAPLIIAEPQRTLPNSTFQLKMVLLVLAATTTGTLLISLRRLAGFRSVTGQASGAVKLLAVGAFALWCAAAAAGRFIAYTQSG